jgi:hypothetical protein
MEFPYTWSDKTIYDMLVRREYLGHTYTKKTHKVSYKIKKTVKHSLDEQLEFLNTHEALVDEETFQVAQKRMSERNRPMKSDEIDTYSGILFCRDCGKRMYVQRGAKTPERKHAYVCGTYRNTAKLSQKCSTHYIRKSVLDELVLADIRRVFRYVTNHKAAFMASAQSKYEKALEKTTLKSRQEHQKGKARLVELDAIFRRLYEDQIFGKLTEAQFASMTVNYNEERDALTRRIAEIHILLKKGDEQKSNTAAFVKIVDKHQSIDELDFELLREFVSKIYIHEVDKENCTREIEILYSFVGSVDVTDEHEEKPSNETYFRQGVGNGACLIKSIVM